MTTTARLAFDSVEERTSHNGGYLFFRQSFGPATCLADIAFKDKLQPLVDLLQIEDKEIWLECEVPRKQTRPHQWRLNEKFYMTNEVDLATVTDDAKVEIERQEVAEAGGRELKEIKVDLPTSLDAELRAMHAIYLSKNPNDLTLREFRNMLIKQQLETLTWRSTSPF